ncbi:MAG: hypothetical protein II139_06620, partial [Lachnospiraceae bacterium]|nr:hypothetical protein [Lachnospiraceae bacterium]
MLLKATFLVNPNSKATAIAVIHALRAWLSRWKVAEKQMPLSASLVFLAYFHIIKGALRAPSSTFFKIHKFLIFQDHNILHFHFTHHSLYFKYNLSIRRHLIMSGTRQPKWLDDAIFYE